MNALDSRRTARLASVLMVIFLLGGSTAFAYATRASGAGTQSHQAPGAGVRPADDNNETQTSSTESHSQSTTTTNSTQSTTACGGDSESTVSCTQVQRTSNETESSTLSTTENSTVFASQNSTLSTTESHSQTGSEQESGNSTETSSHSTNETSVTRTETSSHETETTSQETETSATENGSASSRGLQFALVSAGANQTGRGQVSVESVGLILNVQAEVEGASRLAQYSLVITVNGTSTVLGSLATDGEGEGGIRAQFNATAPGTYAIGVSLKLGGTEALMGTPATGTITVATIPGGQSTTQTHTGEHVSTVQGNQEHESQIRSAEDNRSIPAVVQVNGSGASATVLDSKFSVSVGTLAGKGVAIQITGTNVTGPRVLLVNLSSSAGFTTGSMLVTLDGSPVSQAASLTQVLNPSSSSPAQYIVVSTSTGLQLLVSIPHFSTHVVEILPALAQAVGSLLSVDGPVLALSLLVVTVAFASLYARRPRVKL